MSSLSRFLRRSFSTSPQPSNTAAAAAPERLVKALSADLYKERKLKRLVEKFKKSSEIDRFRTKTGIYQDTIRRLAAAKRFRWIDEILEDQKKYNDMSKEGFNARLIVLYGKSGMFEKAQKLFDEMPKRNSKRTVLSFNALLAACAYSKKFDLVDGLFKELPVKLEIDTDLVSYNTVIKAFCDMGSLDSGFSLFEEMENKGVEPDLITFNTLLNGFYANGQFVDGEKIWGRMLEKNVSPDTRTYNAKLNGLVLEKKTKDAVTLVDEMRRNGIKPDVFSFNVLIKGFVNENNLEEAERWYSEMRNADCKPDKLTFETLIPFASQKGDLGFAFQLSKEVFSRKRIVDEAMLQLVVDGLVKESKIEEAKELVQLGKKNSFFRYKLKLPSDK